MVQCKVCFRHCTLEDGQVGFCGARRCRGGTTVPINYGKLTSLALDPIEKKPLLKFHPGSMILSCGSFGCNLDCQFCQNHVISRAKEGDLPTEYYSPERLVNFADELVMRGNIGIAFTYNEPLVGYEYVRDTARLAHERGLSTVLVTNGTAEMAVLEAILPYIDAMNIDLKGFTDNYYRSICGGDLGQVKAFIERACESCHVELTTLIVPGENDDRESMVREAQWIAGLNGGRGVDIPLHVTRFFPRYKMDDRGPTPLSTIGSLLCTARKYLHHVYPGNC